MDTDPSEFEAIAQGRNTATYFIVAEIAFLAYDYALTFADEVRLVWSSRLSLIKILFFLNRLLGFASPVLVLLIYHGGGNPKSCESLSVALGYINAGVFFNSQLMLSARIYTIWMFDKKVLACLAMLFLFGVVGLSYIAATTAMATTALSVPGLVGLGCLLQLGRNHEWVAFMIILILETSLLCLALLRSFLITRDRVDRTLPGIYRIIVKDNIGYFLCGSLLALGDILFYRVSKSLQLATDFNTVHTGLQSIICARLFLRLRVAAYKQVESVGSLSTWRAWSGFHTSTTTNMGNILSDGDLGSAEES